MKQIITKIYHFTLMIISHLITLLLILFLLMNCTNIPKYVKKKKTLKIYPYADTRDKVFNGKSLLNRIND